ncbi:MAG TPA: glycosyl hydrolase [Candidatus Eisenbacteria bacterium]|nr:glycosyl hydrolase [Candidatus Eisenbacteria bacterium]
MRRSLLLCLFLYLYLAINLSAQVNPALIGGMKWRQIGPFRGGRVLAVAGVPGDPDTYYFGAVAGGIFKSTNGGLSWTPTFDHQSISSIGAIAVAGADHNILYAGSGEACLRGNISYGDGVYKSTDAGHTWTNVGLNDSRHIGAVIIDPRNPEIVLVAALGHAWGPNTERGVFRTADGGKTWQKVLYKDENTGAIDVVFDPKNSSIVYAALWQVRRQPWYFNSGGPGSGLYKSTDGGLSWKQLTGHGLPEGELGRIGVSVSGADSNRVYAIIEAKEGGIYRSDDAGNSWTRVNDDERYRQRAWYFSHIFADPKSADTVYVLNTGAFRSTDGGKTFRLLPAPHGDHHGLWIDPTNPQRLFNSNDGGVTISVDGGKTWTQQNNQPTAQFYHVAVDNHWPYRVYGAQQDNSTVAIASYSDDGVIARQDWYEVGGGESGYISPDPKDPEIVYAGSDSAIITRYDHRTNQLQDVSPYPLDTSGNGADIQKFRFQWTEPVMVSEYDSNVVYTASQYVMKSSDRGHSWNPISPDLTRNDKSKQKPSGGNITLDITSVEYYDTVFALAESPLQKGMLWAGTDDGLIHLTRDDGKTWENVTPKDMPEWSMVSIIDAGHFDAGTAYAAIDRHKLDDFNPVIYKTHDFGKTWTRINQGIPAGSYVRAVREDPKVKGLLYAGTETGVYFSVDDGAHWQSLQLNLPTSPVHDLAVKDNDLVAATHGRSFWILDDVSPLRQASSSIAGADFHLYQPATATRLHFPDAVDRKRPVGDNPPKGAIFYYYLKSKPAEKEEITLDIFDAQGKRVRHLSNLKESKHEQPPEWPDLEIASNLIPAEAGMNRFAWNFRYDPPIQIPGAFYVGDAPRGPLVDPGVYQVRLTVKGQTQTASLEVVIDPRIKEQVSQADLQQLLDLAFKTQQDIDALHRAVNQIRSLRANLQTLEKWTAQGTPNSEVIAAAKALDEKMTPVEEQLIQVKMKSSEGNLRYPNMLNEQYASFNDLIQSFDQAPTAQQLQVFDDLHTRLTAQLAKWQEIEHADVPALNQLMRQHGVPSLTLGSGQGE